MNRTLLLIGVGGFLGSVCRYLAASFFTKIFLSPFPYGTFVVNIAGCFLIGIFYGLSNYYEWIKPGFSVFLITGFCGGFTTFSSFAYESISLIQNSNYFYFALYGIASFALGLLAVLGGLFLINTTLS